MCPLATLGSSLLNLIYPDTCRVCSSPLTDVRRYPVCADCLASVEPFAAEYCCSICRTPFLNSHPLDELGRCALCRLGVAGFDSAYSFGAYEGPLRELIHLFKYRGVASLAAPLGRMLIRALPREQRYDALVPVPLHWLRFWRRGYNQAELLARQLSAQTGIPVLLALRRTRVTASQAGLSSGARRRNVAASFAPRRRRLVQGLRLILIDDVFTTGSTVRAAAQVLKAAGAASVTVLTLARADRRQWIAPLAGYEPRSLALGAS